MEEKDLESYSEELVRYHQGDLGVCRRIFKQRGDEVSFRF